MFVCLGAGLIAGAFLLVKYLDSSMVLWKCAACFNSSLSLLIRSRLAHMATALAFHLLATPAVVFLFHYFAFLLFFSVCFGTTFGTTFLFIDTLLLLVTSAETPAALQVFAVLTVGKRLNSGFRFSSPPP